MSVFRSGGLQNPLFGTVGAAIGGATGALLRPPIQDLINEAWSAHAVRPLSAEVAAALAVEGVWTPERARTEGNYTGVSDSRIDALIQLTDDPPDLATLYALWRRGLIEPDRFIEALKHHRVETPYFEALRQLHDIRLSAEVVANAVQQGHMPNRGVLPNISPAVAPGFTTYPATAPDGRAASHVPLTQIDVDPLDEAAAHGVDVDRLKVLANLVGLPPGPEALLTMWNRDLIDEDSVDAGIREGHMKTKWTAAYKRMRWGVLSATEYAELHLRDWISEEQMYHGGALTGHTPDQMRKLFQNRGRTATPRQVWLAWARKKTGPRGVPADFIDHEQAIRRSNIRPEYAEMLWEIRFNYPPLFQLGRLVTAGAITPATAAEWAEWQLYGPEVITALTKYWESVYPGGDGDVATVDKSRITAARTVAVTEIRSAYLLGQADSEQARGWLERVGVNAPTQDELLPIWDVLREVPQRGLTAAQIVKAYKKLPDQWPRARALDELTQTGLTLDDAATLLDE